MPLAQAQALVPDLAVYPADPVGDARALADLAAWCLRFAPLTSADPSGGIWIDITGCAHLFGGEDALVQRLRAQLQATGLAVRAAVADTPGAAWAVARYRAADATVVAPGASAAMLDPLPVAALRLPAHLPSTLRRLGFERIGALARAPRAPLALRFGAQILQRLDQALGRVFEPITPVVPPAAIVARIAFVEPLLTRGAFAIVVGRLTERVCETLEGRGEGARRLDLLFERIDGSVQAVGVGTARPSRDPAHLTRLLDERLEGMDPEPGVEAMRLAVALSERVTPAALAGGLMGEQMDEAAVAPLVDRMVARFGEARVYRADAVESDVPERSVRIVAPLRAAGVGRWPARFPRPVRLLDPPQPVDAIALLPDQPPVQFTWRGIRHGVRRADGPERIRGEWWRRGGEVATVRDYFAVEDERGSRFWLYRRGDGLDPASGDLRWFLHGLF